MNISRPEAFVDQLTTVAALAGLLERLERSSVPTDPGQYRVVALRLAKALREAPPGIGLESLLDSHPAAAELYENLNYAHAGLCRTPLARSVATEGLARVAIEQAARFERT